MATVIRPKIRSAFGEMLRADLDDIDVSLKALARRLAGDGATEAQINGQRRFLQKCIAGEVSPTQPKRERIAAALGFPADRYDDDAERRSEMQEIADALLPLVNVLHRLVVKAKEEAQR